MTEISKSFASKNQVETTLDLGDQNRDKMEKLKTLNYLLAKVILTMMDCKIIPYFNQFLSLRKYLLILSIKCLYENMKSFQKQVPELMLHQTIILL